MLAEMVAHRLAKITVRFQMPTKLPEADRVKIEQASTMCPIYQALKPTVPVVVDFAWPA